MTNYVDLDPGSGIRDWDCTDITYNGHGGLDSGMPSFKRQAIGVPIFAALDGTVVEAHDGEPDMNTAMGNAPANYVILDHGGTHYTW
jgi:murein DD-endopeptidase MepM/ murein hydrolase activator NlpD